MTLDILQTWPDAPTAARDLGSSADFAAVVGCSTRAADSWRGGQRRPPWDVLEAMAVHRYGEGNAVVPMGGAVLLVSRRRPHTSPEGPHTAPVT